MDCKEILSRLDEYVDGELEAPVAEGVRGHLEDCAGCRRASAELGRLKRLVQSRCKQLPAPAALRESIRERLAGELARSRKVLLRRAAAAVLVGGTAAGLLVLWQWREPRLGHAEAARGCAEAFSQVLASHGVIAPAGGDWRERLREEIRRTSGISLDRLPEIPDSKFLGWERQTVKGVKGVRLDFQPCGPRGGLPAGEPCPGALISVFFLPLKYMDFSPEYIAALEKGHPCTRCIKMRDGGIYCYRRDEFLVSVVSNLPERELKNSR